MGPNRHEEQLQADQRRWSRIEAAKTPEELADAFRPTRRLARRVALRRVATVLASVVLVVAWFAFRFLPELLPRVLDEPTAAPTEQSLPSLALPRRPVVNVVPLNGTKAGVSVQVNPGAWSSYDPEWRPDGKALLVMTPRGAVELPRSRDGRPNWDRMRVLTDELAGSPSYSPSNHQLADLDGVGQVRIVAPERGTARTLSLPGGLVPRGLDWSVDDRLAVATRTKVFVLRPFGTVLREIDLGQGVAFPEWSPEGTRLLVTRIDRKRELVVISTETGTWRRLLRTNEPSAWGTWSPDGRYVAFAKFIDHSWDVFVVDVDSGREWRLTSGVAPETSPAWSPDGRWLAYVTEQP
jgi:dipeptidyl aminopeptidase/acylaminoacyl peptidase